MSMHHSPILVGFVVWLLLASPAPGTATDLEVSVRVSMLGGAARRRPDGEGRRGGHQGDDAARRRKDVVLVVEDDRAVQDIVSLFLSDAYEVKQATTRAEAVRIVRRELVGVVVLDYRLPDGTGLEVLREMRAARPGLPVIMITGYGSESLCAAAFRSGVRDYFPKPVNLFALRQAVGRALSEDQGDEQEPWTREPSRRQPHMAIQKTAVLIQQRYWERLTLSRLAGAVGMSKFHLSHRFSDEMG